MMLNFAACFQVQINNHHRKSYCKESFVTVEHIVVPGVIFSFADYGSRLLFKTGKINPRDELGKLGIRYQLSLQFHFMVLSDGKSSNKHNRHRRKRA
jgi:hypothetical protein